MFKRILYVILALAGIFILIPELISKAQVKKTISRSGFRDGDIIFQSSDSRQCQAIKIATHSDISHCGLLISEGGKWYVLEAVEPVQLISLPAFIGRDPQQHYTVKRLKNEFLPKQDAFEKMLAEGKRWIGKHYDIYFNWSGSELYCSELVWKLYHNVPGIDLCNLRRLKDFDLSSPLVKEMMNERYGNKIPYDESVVAPSDIFNSEKLEMVSQY